MHKAWYERIHGSGTYEMDERDATLLAERIAKRSLLDGPLVGDFVITPKGVLRFTHDWGDGLQTTVANGHPCYGDISFYISREGHMSFSGSLDPAIPKDQLEPTREVQDGACWFFSHDHPEAANGIYVRVPCKVYRLRQ